MSPRDPVCVRCRTGWSSEGLCHRVAGVACVHVKLGRRVCDSVGGVPKSRGRILNRGSNCAGMLGTLEPAALCWKGPSLRCGGACVVRDVRHDGGHCVRGARRGRACERGGQRMG